MIRYCTSVLLALAMAGCSGRETAAAAQPMRSSASTTTTVGGATLQASTMDIADLNDEVARRYAIDRSATGLLLLLTVRDAHGNALAPGDLQLEVTSAALTDAPKPLAMHPITTGGMTDYIGVFDAAPPATVQFRIIAVRNSARAEIATTAELYPR